MIGPQAYENLFYYPSVTWSVRDIEIKYNGVLYTYSGDGAWELFDTRGHFKVWCIDDVTDNNGEYADKREVIA